MEINEVAILNWKEENSSLFGEYYEANHNGLYYEVAKVNFSPEWWRARIYNDGALEVEKKNFFSAESAKESISEYVITLKKTTPNNQQNEIKIDREKRKLTQKQYAKLFNVSLDTVKSWETGRRDINNLWRIISKFTTEQIENARIDFITKKDHEVKHEYES